MSFSRCVTGLFCILALITVNTSSARADVRSADGSKAAPYAVPRIADAATVDGRLDEAIWQSALVLELRYEVEPGENVPPAARTEVLIASNRDTLFIGFRAWEPAMDALRSHLSPRDQIDEDDRVGVSFDTFNDERGMLQFLVNPLGVQADRVWKEGQDSPDTNWDTIWDSATAIEDWGWSAELAIPFSSLRFQRVEGRQIWGFEAVRYHPRDRSELLSIFPHDRNNSNLYAQMVKIAGFDDITPARNIELVPTLVLGRMDERPGGPQGEFVTTSENSDLGLSGRWGVTPNLTLQTAINPDFSQVEADALQLSLNEQFALQYDEKRPFFTEGNDFFQTPLNVVYTRAVSAPTWGFKLSGKEGPHAIGAFVLKDDVSGLVIPGLWSSAATILPQQTTAGVLHYRQDIGDSSTLGLLMTDREGAEGNYFNRVLGVDGRIRFSSADTMQFQLLGSSTRYDSATADAFNQRSDTFTGGALYTLFRHESREISMLAEYTRIDDQFRADLGFMPQVGFQQLFTRIGKIHRGDSDSFLSYLEYGTGFIGIGGVGADERLVDREMFGYVRFNGPLQSFLEVDLGRRRVNYLDLSTVQNYMNVFFNFAPTGFLRFGLGGWRPSDWIDYTHARPAFRNTIAPFVDMRLGEHLNLFVQQTITSLTVDGDRLFLANLTQVTVQYNFDRRAFLRAILQYSDIRRNPDLYTAKVDRLSRSLYSQFLFSYMLNPRTVLFIGYGDTMNGTQDQELYRTQRSFFTKLGYSWML